MPIFVVVMTFGDKESCLAYLENLRIKCRARYKELYSEYKDLESNMSDTRKREVDEFIRLQIECEFGKCYL